jgi:hypothetical protein
MAVATHKSPQAAIRAGKKNISAFFSPNLQQGLRILAAEQDKTIQFLMGEAFDLLMKRYGKQPFGER